MASPASIESHAFNDSWARLEALRVGSGLIEVVRDDPGLPFGPWVVAQTVSGGVSFSEARQFSGSQIVLDGDRSGLQAEIRIVRPDPDVDFEERTANVSLDPESFSPLPTFKKYEAGLMVYEGMLTHPYSIDDFLCNLLAIEGQKGAPAPSRIPRHQRASQHILQILHR